MSNTEKLKSYVSKVLGYILADINQLRQKGVTVSFPYLFLSFAGIDFLGGFEYGFERGNSRKRSTWFISTWMNKVNGRYIFSDPDNPLSQASYLYTFARSGLIHMACVQQSVVVATDASLEKHHLGYAHDGESKVFIHPLLFSEEFEKASALHLEHVYSDSTKVAAALNHLEVYIKEKSGEEKEFPLNELFYNLATENLSVANVATSSATDISRFGTQGPR